MKRPRFKRMLFFAGLGFLFGADRISEQLIYEIAPATWQTVLWACAHLAVCLTGWLCLAGGYQWALREVRRCLDFAHDLATASSLDQRILRVANRRGRPVAAAEIAIYPGYSVRAICRRLAALEKHGAIVSWLDERGVLVYGLTNLPALTAHDSSAPVQKEARPWES